MKRKFLWILSLLLLIQFVRPDKNDSTLIEEDYSKDLKISADVKSLLKKSCADCHSNRTNYPWYAEIAPVSWYLANHVNDGKAHLNFSEWDQYNKNQKNYFFFFGWQVPHLVGALFALWQSLQSLCPLSFVHAPAV